MINADADEVDKMSKYFHAKDESIAISIFFPESTRQCESSVLELNIKTFENIWDQNITF